MKAEDKKQKQVLIIGGGFGGVACAKRLAKQAPDGVKIRLVSDKSHFEYHGALYRVVTGRSPMEICIPLREIFEGLEVEVVRDKIVKLDLGKQVARGESESVYGYDALVVAVGSETAYYGIPGLEKLSYGFKSISEALELKRRLHEVIGNCAGKEKGTVEGDAHVVVVGGGASGTELAAELAVYGKQVAKSHGVDPTLVRVELVQSANRLLPDLPEEISRRVEEKVRSLGVNVYLNQRLEREEVERVYFPDMEMKAKTVVWTAGVKANRLYAQTKGWEISQAGRVIVDKYLRAKGNMGVYVVGDGAESRWSGMAQTAMGDGLLVAENLAVKWQGKEMKVREAEQPVYAIPCGPGWAAVWMGGKEYYGRAGWWLRRYLDWRVFRSLLPLEKAATVFRSGGKLSETCEVCGKMLEKSYNG